MHTQSRLPNVLGLSCVLALNAGFATAVSANEHQQACADHIQDKIAWGSSGDKH
jgi:hypothetical protein